MFDDLEGKEIERNEAKIENEKITGNGKVGNPSK